MLDCEELETDDLQRMEERLVGLVDVLLLSQSGFVASRWMQGRMIDSLLIYGWDP